MNYERLRKIASLLRYNILTSTTAAQSGHLTSSLSAVELIATLYFGDSFFRYDFENPKNITNDRFILSKGHASPLLYSVLQVAGVISSDELMRLRRFDSILEGHPTPRLKYVDVATGSLGQGLSLGIGMALAMRQRIKKGPLPHVWVLMGDSEMAEGQVWEAMEFASYYNMHNLIGIIDVNRLGQRGETMLGWNIEAYAHRCRSFGWQTIELNDGHDIEKIESVYQEALNPVYPGKNKRPTIIIAKTVKGKGVSFLENKEGWHGKTLTQEQLNSALKELGEVDREIRELIQKPMFTDPVSPSLPISAPNIQAVGTPSSQHSKTEISTREAYGNELVEIGKTHENVVVLDAEVSNSTFSIQFKNACPDRFYEMFIAEQNMISVAVGMQSLGLLPFLSTFSSFFTRAFDQIRMAQYSNANIKLVGSHAGISIGQDGPSQMGLEDIAMMRSILESVVLSPSDSISAKALTDLMATHQGISYMRTMRNKSPALYSSGENFKLGGSKTLHKSNEDAYCIFGTGATVHESLKAYTSLLQKGIKGTIVDIYSIKPIDEQTIIDIARRTKHILVVEDHYPYGGLGEVISATLVRNHVPFSSFTHLAVHKSPRSGTPEELFMYEEINADSIVTNILKNLP